MISSTKFFLFCLIIICLKGNVQLLQIKTTNYQNQSDLIDSSSVTSSDDNHLLESELKNANIALEKNNIWLAKLRGKNLDDIPLLSTITLKYEIKDIIKFMKSVKDNLRKNFTKIVSSSSLNQNLIRQYEFIAKLDYNVLPLLETFLINDILEQNKIEMNFCSFNHSDSNCTLNGKDLFNIITASDDVEILNFYFVQFMEKLGKNKMEKYTEFLKLFNNAAKLNGFENANEMLKFPYELNKKVNGSNNYIDDILKSIMDEIKPFHRQLYAYIRHHLQKKFNTVNETLIRYDGPIPDYLHQKLIANTYADDLQFFEFKPVNEYDSLRYKNATKMLADIKSKYQSFGFEIGKMPLSVIIGENWSHPKFDDSYGRKELKLNIGLNATENQFYETFLEYFKYLEFTYGYSQPWIFRKLLPRAFSTSIANALKHSLENITLNDVDTSSINISNLNRFITKAIQNIFGIQSKYVTSQTIKCLQTRELKNETCEFWSKKLEFQGISTNRIDSNSEVLAWKLNAWNEDDYGDIISIILGFQIYEGLCEKIDIKIDNLSNCDFSGRTKIGQTIKKIFMEGSSISWKEQIKNLLPKDQQNNEAILSAKSMLKYFQPLYEWLEEYNKINNVEIEWNF
ncbi:angiotensin-converting enzyme-like [Condylostylus longicornis]|uniref:angiotensin-converting enzyme-like n=1 Tax=Condylostylus longicornis TaxID=2530218 RepID=UPI00244DEF9F|nr:angiotensin-converting enzyme-like [Condylostylus longicornis]